MFGSHYLEFVSVKRGHIYSFLSFLMKNKAEEKRWMKMMDGFHTRKVRPGRSVLPDF